MSFDVICGRVMFPLDGSWNCFCFSIRNHSRITPVKAKTVMVASNGRVSYYDYESDDNQLVAMGQAVSNLHNCLSDMISKKHREYDEVMSLIFPVTENAALGKTPLTLEDIDRINFIMMNVLNSKNQFKE